MITPLFSVKKTMSVFPVQPKAEEIMLFLSLAYPPHIQRYKVPTGYCFSEFSFTAKKRLRVNSDIPDIGDGISLFSRQNVAFMLYPEGVKEIYV